MSTKLTKDIELDTRGRQFEPYLTAGFVCTTVAPLLCRRWPCAVCAGARWKMGKGVKIRPIVLFWQLLSVDSFTSRYPHCRHKSARESDFKIWRAMPVIFANHRLSRSTDIIRWQMQNARDEIRETMHPGQSMRDLYEPLAFVENTSVHWVQRRISFTTHESNDPQLNLGIGNHVADHVKEIRDFEIGIAYLQIQTPGLGFVLVPNNQKQGLEELDAAKSNSLASASQFMFVTITNGSLSIGAGCPTDAAVRCLASAPHDLAGVQPRRDAVELLVTLQGVRRTPAPLLARPASHTSGQPRPGDSLSPLRAAALREALRGHGVELDVLLSSPDFHASSARRTCLTFINPRPNRVPNKIEPLEQAAARCAQQVPRPSRPSRCRARVSCARAGAALLPRPLRTALRAALRAALRGALSVAPPERSHTRLGATRKGPVPRSGSTRK